MNGTRPQSSQELYPLRIITTGGNTTSGRILVVERALPAALSTRYTRAKSVKGGLFSFRSVRTQKEDVHLWRIADLPSQKQREATSSFDLSFSSRLLFLLLLYIYDIVAKDETR